MKVICIESKWTPASSNIVDFPVYGNVYNVVQEGFDFINQPCYELAEFPRKWVLKSCFIPLSDIDETEFIREYNTEKV